MHQNYCVISIQGEYTRVDKSAQELRSNSHVQSNCIDCGRIEVECHWTLSVVDTVLKRFNSWGTYYLSYLEYSHAVQLSWRYVCTSHAGEYGHSVLPLVDLKFAWRWKLRHSFQRSTIRKGRKEKFYIEVQHPITQNKIEAW